MTSFKANKEGSVNVGETAVSTTAPGVTTIVPSEPREAPAFKVGSVSGPVRRSDFKMPSLKIVHNVGELQDSFEPGSLVLNKEVVLSDGEKPIKLTVLSFRKFFLEKLKEFGKEMPRQFSTEAELSAAGLHTQWIGNEPPPAIDAGEALVAIESDTESPHFPFNYGDKYYTLAVWHLNSASAYNRAGKMIVTSSEWGLKDGLHHGSWTLSTRREKMGRNFVFVPVLKSGPRNSKELAEFFASLL